MYQVISYAILLSIVFVIVFSIIKLIKNKLIEDFPKSPRTLSIITFCIMGFFSLLETLGMPNPFTAGSTSPLVGVSGLIISLAILLSGIASRKSSGCAVASLIISLFGLMFNIATILSFIGAIIALVNHSKIKKYAKLAELYQKRKVEQNDTYSRNRILSKTEDNESATSEDVDVVDNQYFTSTNTSTSKNRTHYTNKTFAGGVVCSILSAIFVVISVLLICQLNEDSWFAIITGIGAMALGYFGYDLLYKYYDENRDKLGAVIVFSILTAVQFHLVFMFSNLYFIHKTYSDKGQGFLSIDSRYIVCLSVSTIASIFFLVWGMIQFPQIVEFEEMWLCYLTLAGGVVFGFSSHLFAKAIKMETDNIISKIVWIITFPQFFAGIGLAYAVGVFVMIMVFVITSIIKLFIGEFAGSSSSTTYTAEQWEVVDPETGFRRTIEKDSGNRYRDDLGREWKTDDNGRTFYK